MLEDLTWDGAGDAAATERFCAALLADPAPSLWTLWICEPDHSQHELELGSPEHRAVLEGADRCVALVTETVEALRGRGEDVLFVVCSDHGHETVDAVVPVVDHLVEAGLKAAPDSPETVLASSGMGALIYLGGNDAPDAASVAAWLRAQPWCEQVFTGEGLSEVGLRPGAGPAVAFGMAKREASNRFGIPGLGYVAADLFMKSDAPGRGQHGGLGPYETRPVLIVSGGGFSPGRHAARSSAVDIAPTILRHLARRRSIHRWTARRFRLTDGSPRGGGCGATALTRSPPEPDGRGFAFGDGVRPRRGRLCSWGSPERQSTMPLNA